MSNATLHGRLFVPLSYAPWARICEVPLLLFATGPLSLIWGELSVHFASSNRKIAHGVLYEVGQTVANRMNCIHIKNSRQVSLEFLF